MMRFALRADKLRYSRAGTPKFLSVSGGVMIRKPDRETAFQQTVELLYEAVAEPDRWTEALDQTQNLLGAMSSRIFLWDARVDRMTTFMNSSTYTGHAAKWDLQITDPRRRILEKSAAGYILTCHEHFDNAFVSRNPFYTDFSLPFDRRYLMAANMLSQDGIVSIFSLFRSARQGCFDGDDRIMFERLNVHLQRIGRIHRRLSISQADSELRQGVLDCLSTALLLTDATGRLVRLNAAAEELLASNTILRVQAGFLHANTHSDSQKLQALIGRTVATTEGLNADAGGSMILEDAAGNRHAVTVSPLSRRSAVLGKPEQPLALISVGELRPFGNPARQLVELFGLTMAEARLASDVASGRRLEQIASERGVKMPTLRTQLAAVFGKTGTGRQAELVQILTQLAGLLGSTAETASQRRAPGLDPSRLNDKYPAIR